MTNLQYYEILLVSSLFNIKTRELKYRCYKPTYIHLFLSWSRWFLHQTIQWKIQGKIACLLTAGGGYETQRLLLPSVFYTEPYTSSLLLSTVQKPLYTLTKLDLRLPFFLQWTHPSRRISSIKVFTSWMHGWNQIQKLFMTREQIYNILPCNLAVRITVTPTSTTMLSFF